MSSIIIIDFGSQFIQLIARRVREVGVYSHIIPYDSFSQADLEKYQPQGIILSGGPASVGSDFAPEMPAAIDKYTGPVLGICYGMQLLSQRYGGTVEPSNKREYGRAAIRVRQSCALFDGVWEEGANPDVWMSRADKVSTIPDNFKVVADSAHSPFAVIADEKRGLYGVQFHCEVTHTQDGAALLRNFVTNICKITPNWSMANYCANEIARIREKLGSEEVICGLSGGVDSAVTAALIHRAVGDQLTCIFVDHGLLRAGEADQVVAVFQDHFQCRLIKIDAADRFFAALDGVTDPEQKRKIIGAQFVQEF
ncbi:MAG: glutamine-hydrolyzing GMP synthase, partial [Pseudomonadota bacterium]